MADDDRIARALAGVTNVLRMPSRVARSMVEGFDDLVERAKTESTSAALGGDFNPQPGMELATGAIGGGTPFAVRGALGAAGGKVIQPQGIRAYHGSPHDFERFDMSKIGTGEGAQAYGHGLYFAENPAVAADYKKRLALQADLSGAGRLETEALKYVNAHGGIDEARAAVDAEMKQWKDSPQTVAYLTALRDAIRAPNPGKMYEVNIRAEPQQFLDWDKKVRDMPPEVQANLSRFGLNINGPDQGLVGSQIVNRGIDAGGGATAAREFSEAGIPGIRYLDQGSRFQGPNVSLWETYLADAKKAGDTGKVAELEARLAEMRQPQTSNYVLFRDDIIDILRKYGIAVPPTGAALANQGRVADALAGEQQ